MFALFLLLACESDPIDPPTTDTVDTGTEGRCVPTNNALRLDCPLSTPGTVRWWPEDDPSDVRSADGDTNVRIYGLRPDVSTIVAFPDGTEELQSIGPLPDTIADIVATITGDGLSTWVAVSGSCSSRELVVVDGLGRPRWYEPVERKVLAIDASPTNTLVTLIGSQTLVEWSPTGTMIWSAIYDDPGPLHHDIARDKKGFTYALRASVFPIDEENYVLDSLAVFNPDGDHVDTWELIDHLPDIYEPTNNNGYWTVRFPNAIDFSHGNSVEVTADGDLLLSFRWLDTLLKINGDPEAPGFGTPRWWLSATDQVPSDIALVGTGAAFDGQHHATIAPDGRLLLFDNTVRDTNSRGMAYVLTETTATVDQIWPLPFDCTVQGSTYGLDDGGSQVTCASRSLITEFPANSPVPRGSLDLECASGMSSLIARAVPIDW